MKKGRSLLWDDETTGPEPFRSVLHDMEGARARVRGPHSFGPAILPLGDRLTRHSPSQQHWVRRVRQATGRILQQIRVWQIHRA